MARGSMPRTAGRRVWVVSHCEILVFPRYWHVDEMVFGAASSMRGARRLIRETCVEAGSWWRVDVARVDSVHEDTQVLYFTREGRRTSRAPVHLGIRAWPRRRARQLAQVRDMLRSPVIREHPLRLRRFRRTLRDMLRLPARLS